MDVATAVVEAARARVAHPAALAAAAVRPTAEPNLLHTARLRHRVQCPRRMVLLL
ncbi:MAG: hypothetical protein KI785_13265 [Devosiaceae bacterium]|nr:hypothetical protein [Devosiaceae bacterium MH13]